MKVEEACRNAIRDVPDFPKKGIIFKDITPIFKNSTLVKNVLDALVEKYRSMDIDVIVGIESRGFLLGVPLAMALKKPFVLIRKKGKLPYDTVSHKYELEYGTAEIEMHIDAISQGQKVLIHDDLLATGGSASAAAELILKQKGEIIGFDFLIELSFLNGRANLFKYSKNISNFVNY